MIGQKLNYSTISRDRLVHCCKSATVADIFERVLKDEPQANRERVTERLTGAGVSDSAKIIKEVEKVTSGVKRKQCMHCDNLQGKIMLDKPSTFTERIDNARTGKEPER